MRIVSNSTPLIALSRVNELELLHSLFGTIIIPSAVYNEVVLEGAGRPGVKEVADAFWILTLLFRYFKWTLTVGRQRLLF